MSPYSQRTWISQKHTRMDKRTTFVQNAKCVRHLLKTANVLDICTFVHTPIPLCTKRHTPMYKTTYPLCTKRHTPYVQNDNIRIKIKNKKKK